MRRKNVFLVFLCLILGLCSCRNAQEQDGSDAVTATQNIATPTPEAIEDFSDVEKHVIWYREKWNPKAIDSRVFASFNRLLLERGYDFVVDFVGNECSWPGAYDNYQKNLREYRKQGKQVDLIDTNVVLKDVSMTYEDAIRDELLAPLDDFLSAEGKEISEIYPVGVLEQLRRDGKIYGIIANGWYGGYYSAIISKEYLEKYGVEPPETFSFEAYFKAIREVYKKAQEDGKELLPLYLSEDAVYSYLGYYKAGDFWLKQKEDGILAYVNPYEDEEARQLFELLEEYSAVFGGYSASEKNGEKQYGEYIRNNLVIASFSASKMQKDCSNNSLSYPAYTYEPQTLFYSLPVHNHVLGISSWATYPEEAKTLMTLLTTDEEFINLFSLGVEGVNYRLVDGKAVVKEEKGLRTPKTTCYNALLQYPYAAEPLNKRELLQKNHQSIILLPEEVETIMNSPLSESEEAVAALFRKAEGLWLGKCENAKQTAEEICMELEAANVDEVLQNLTERISREEQQ